MSACHACGADHTGSAKFCAECGAPRLSPLCAGCGAEIWLEAKFCPECGSAQTTVSQAGPQSARRVTSVLFGDLVGFTALSEARDHEEVRELLGRYFHECRTVIARYGGIVEKFIGDAVMAVWGVPTAHEDDAERAVRAGLELVAAVSDLGSDISVPELAIRVGVVTGEVAVTVGATGQGMVAGDPVNTAARVQSTAASGEVWVDERTRLLTSTTVSYDPVGSHVMKGKTEPMSLWAARSVLSAGGGRQRVDGLEAPQVGRARELRLVKEIFHTVEEAHRPALLVLCGDAGIGKTRLGREFTKYADGLSTCLRWHSGRCLSYGEGVAFYALAEVVRGRLQSLVIGDEDEPDVEDQATLLRIALDRLAIDAEEREWLESRLAALLGLEQAASLGREDLFHAWTTFLQRVSEMTTDLDVTGPVPLVIMIEDAQHVDDGLVAFFDHLLMAARFPVLVVLIARPELLVRHPSLAVNRRVTVLNLEALSARQMGEVLDGLVEGIPRLVREALAARADGVPLFAVEAVRSLIDQGLVVPRGGRYVLADDADLDVASLAAPVSLHALLTARLDALPPDQRRVLQVASVVGTSFTREQVAAIAEGDDVAAVLTRLVRAQVLRMETSRLSSEHGQYQFVQTALRQVALAMLARRDRKRLHLTMAAHLEQGANPAGEISGIIAQHLWDAADAVAGAEDAAAISERAVAHLLRAASRASSLGAPAEAAAHLEAAMLRTDDGDVRAAVELDLARAQLACGRYEAAGEHGARVLSYYDGTKEPVAAALAADVIADSQRATGDFDAAWGLVEERLAAIKGLAGSARAEITLVGRQVTIAHLLGVDVFPIAMQQLLLAERIGGPRDLAEAYMSLALGYHIRGAPHLTDLLLEQVVEISERLHDRLHSARALAKMAAAWTGEDAARAAGLAVRAWEAARVAGNQRQLDDAVVNATLAWTVHGSWDEVVAVRADELAIDRLWVEAAQGELAAARGETWRPVLPPDLGGEKDTGTRAFARAIQAREAADRLLPVAELTRAALTDYYEFSRFADDFPCLFWMLSESAWAARDGDALRTALAVLAEHPDDRRPVGLLALEALGRARLATLDGDETDEVFLAATELAEAWHSTPMVAQSQAVYAAWLVAAGRPADAEPLIVQARAAFGRLGAAAWAAALDESLTGRETRLSSTS